MFTLKRSRQFIALTLGCLLSGAALAGTISTFAGSGTNGHQDGALSAAQFSAPMGLALDGVSSTLYLSDSHSIRSINMISGTVSTVAGDGTTGVFNLPSDLALDNAGNLYIIDQNNQSLKRLELATGLVTVVLDGTQLTDPQGVTVDDTGMVYVADAGANQILKVDASVTPATVTVLALDAGATALNSPQGLAINGNKLYVAEPLAHRVRVIDLSAAPATLFTVAGGTGKTFYNFANPGITGAQANLKTPTDLVLDSAGNLYISDVGHNRVLKWDVATQLVTVVAGVGSSLGVGGFSGDGGQGRLAEIDQPVGLAVDSAGVLYFADSNNQRIRSVANDMMAVPVTTTTTNTNTNTTTPTSTATTGNTANQAGDALNGKTLYAAGCSSCHGADPATGHSKIANGTSGLVITTKHSFVTAGEAVDLAAYISSRVGTTTTPTTTTTTSTPTTNTTSGSTGAQLYSSNCASCHGADPVNNRRNIAKATTASAISRKHGTQYSSSTESTQIAAYISSRVLSSGTTLPVDSTSSASQSCGGDDDFSDSDGGDDCGGTGSTAPTLLLMMLSAVLLRRRYG